MLLVQSIQITDKFGFDKQTSMEKARASSETVFVANDPATAFCVNGLGNFSNSKYILQGNSLTFNFGILFFRISDNSIQVLLLLELYSYWHN